MHWAAMPMEIIWEGFEDMKCDYQEAEWQGVKMLVDSTSDGYGRIVRLLSPNPYDYLKASLAPGQRVPLFTQQ